MTGKLLNGPYYTKTSFTLISKLRSRNHNTLTLSCQLLYDRLLISTIFQWSNSGFAICISILWTLAQTIPMTRQKSSSLQTCLKPSCALLFGLDPLLITYFYNLVQCHRPCISIISKSFLLCWILRASPNFPLVIFEPWSWCSCISNNISNLSPITNTIVP